MHYFITRGSQEYGPYTLGDLQRYLASGHVSPEDTVRPDGGVAATLRVRELLAQASPSASPFPPTGTESLTSGIPGTSARQAPFPIAIPPGAYVPAYQKPTMANGAPLPPNLHWGLLLLFHFLTCGVITLVWMFLQAWWVKQLDRSSRAVWFFAGHLGISYLIGTPIGFALNFVDEDSFRESPVVWIALAGTVILVTLASLVLYVMGAFSMRRSLQDYFNSTENIGLRLGPVMTFFFPIWYFQYHINRIVQWKRTGILPS